MFNDLLKGRTAPKAAKEPYVYQEFPKGMHHPELGCRVVATPEEAERLLSEGWYDSPADFPPVEAQSEPKGEGEVAGDTTELLNKINQLGEEKAALQAQFDKSWAGAQKEIADLHIEIAKHEGAVADLKKQLKAAQKAVAKQPEAAK